MEKLILAWTAAALVFCACAANNIVIMRGTGNNLGAVRASADVSENRVTGEITGDTMKYGYIDKMSNALSAGLNTGIYSDDDADDAIPRGAANKAYANAVYDIIQQVKKLGGNGLTNVLSRVDRNYDPETKIETVTVSITADAVKLDKKKTAAK